ncbi:MAG: ZIP family metal transporter [Bacteroidales bacterium]|nr:ZIP family metal transporter [Bacteroidales bacterium]
MIWAVLLPGRKKVPDGVLEYLNIFCGAFLLGICFVNLVPHIFATGFTTPHLHLKVGAAVLVGFGLQLLLEQLTGGVEHGHNHCECCGEGNGENISHSADKHHHHHHQGHCHEHGAHPVNGLLLGLSLHAFVEGMPLVGVEGTVHTGLLYGLLIHNIPIALVLLTMCMAGGYSAWKSMGVMALFALMTPLGSLCSVLFLPPSETLEALLMGLVVGILLHVSVSILFDHGQSRLHWGKLAIIILAFTAAYFVPGCAEIY